MNSSPPNLYALLIGIDCYLPNRLPDGGSYPSLGGCVRDINHVEAYLKEWQQVPDSHILKLTATSSANDPQSPLEVETQLPTRQHIVDSFRQLGELAPAGAQVYIHYSGHGGRAKTEYAQIKGAGEIDECLVPTDIGADDGQYLRDLELAHLLQELVDRQLIVTVILDCCHSGGATRGDAAIRGSQKVGDKPFHASWQPVASIEALTATWRSLTGQGTRGLKAGGLPASSNYVVLAACRQNEYAYEYAFNRESQERNGALTYWLLDTLKQPHPGQTYQDLYARVNAQIHSQFAAQTPLLLGAGDRQILGSGRGQFVFAVPVMKVEVTAEGETQAILGVGQANGITKGAEFAIYPRGVQDLTKKAERVAIARILQRGATESICRLTPIEGQAIQTEAGDLAVQIAVAPSLVRQVALLPTGELDVQTQQALTALRAAIPGNGWVELADQNNLAQGDNGEGVDFFVEVNAQKVYEIRDSGGAVISNIQPVLSVADSTAPERVVQRLKHLAKYRATLTIDNIDVDAPLAGKLAVTWLGTSDTYDRGDPIPPVSQLQKFPDPSKPSVSVGNYIFLAIRNDSEQALNVAVLNCEADWSITQIYPPKPELFFTLEPGKSQVLPLQPSIEGSAQSVENIVKVFATKDIANFRWLELPSLDQKLAPKGLATRSVASSPLDALMAAIDAEQPKTRKLEVATSPSTEWTTQQVILTITKS